MSDLLRRRAPNAVVQDGKEQPVTRIGRRTPARISIVAAMLAVVPLCLSATCAAQDPALRQDVIYGHAGDADLKLDLAVPAAGSGPFPIIVFIHGGGWSAGSKAQYDQAIVGSAGQGYVAASIDYRFAPRFPFPAQIEDAKCAVRYLRAHAKELDADPTRIAAVGDSAGGHLALLLGLMDAQDGLEGGGGWPEQPSKVQVVVNYYGPADLRTIKEDNPAVVDLVAGLLGTADLHSAIAAQASPLVYIDSHDAPVLTLHGAKDTLVPLDQSRRLHDALKLAGVEEHLEVFADAGHGFGGQDAERALLLTREFLDRHLKPR
jgi:acetyl esterase/lipase